MRKLLICGLAASMFVVPLALPGMPDSTVETDRWGCVIRVNPASPEVHLVFSADSMFEGGAYALDVLDSAGVKGSFFFTGNFLRDPANAAVIRRVVDGGHYVGPHSDRHILLADWDRARTTLVDADSMMADLYANYGELARFGVMLEESRHVLPPFEWCNATHSAAMRSAGFIPVNLTPGIETYRDYTTPDMAEYRSSDSMLRQLWEYEEEHGLNGSLIIVHLGTQEARTDKLYSHLPEILDSLAARGYAIERVDKE